MKELNTQEAMQINGGKTYHCPYGCRKSGGYWSVYWHCLTNRCFTRNKYMNALWKAAGWCISTALGNELCRGINMATYPGKH